MSTEGTDDQSELVRTYIPSSQKDIWEDHAETLGMSMSEFVRSMVQAGRRDFLSHEEPDTRAVTPRSNAVETTLLDILRNEPKSRDELLAEATDDLEQRIIETIIDLDKAGRVDFDVRLDKFVLLEES